MIWLAQVKVSCQEISEAIQKLVSKKGWRWSCEKIGFFMNDHPYLLLSEDSERRQFYHTHIYNPIYGKLMTIEEIMNFINSVPNEIKIGQYSVLFPKNSIGQCERIEVGCQKIPKKIVKEIYEKLN